MEKENLQHVQLPNKQESESITPQDQLIYVSIKRYMNNKTKEAFPSLQTISEVSGAAINTIRKCIKNLEKADYITIRKKGRQNIYCFNPYKEFEPFSYEFLDNKNISFTEKSYLLASQQHMYKYNGQGSISYTNKELSSKINMPESTVSKCNRQLESKGYLTILNNENREIESGCKTQTKLFHLSKFGQAVVFALQNHEERLCNAEDKLAKVEEENKQIKKSYELLLKKIENLENNNKKEIIID